MSFTLLFRQKAEDTDRKIIEAAETFRNECGALLEDLYIERLHSVTPEYMARHGRIYRVDARTPARPDPIQGETLDQSLMLLLMAAGLESGFVPMDEDGEALYDPAALGLDLAGQESWGIQTEDAELPLPGIFSCQDGEAGDLVLLAAQGPEAAADRAKLAHYAYLRLLRRAGRDGLTEL